MLLTVYIPHSSHTGRSMMSWIRRANLSRKAGSDCKRHLSGRIVTSDSASECQRMVPAQKILVPRSKT